MTRGIPSIRRDLFLRLLATALLPLLVVGALSVALLMDYLKGDALDDGDHIALNMAAQLRGRLAAAESAAHTLAGVLRSLEPGSGNAATTERIMCETVRSQSLFEAIYLVGPECRVLSIGLPESQRARTEDFIGIDLSRLPLLQQTLKEKVPLWSDSQLSLITGQPGLSYCIPHKDGLLVVACTLPAMENLPKVHGGSRVYSTLLLDAKGVVLIETNGRRPGKIIKLDHEPLIAASLAGKADKGAFQWGGLECLGSTVIIPQTGWVVISFASRTEALRTLNLMLGLSVLGIVLGALFAGLLALAMARRIVKPLAVLSDMTTEIAGGKYGATIDSQPYRELEQVAASLRSMGATIQERERRQQDTEAELRQAQKMEAVGRLVGGIAHDFNNMLQGIRGFTELARSDLPEEHPVQEHLSEVNNASSRAAELVQQLLIFSRKDNPKPCHIDLNEFLAQSLKMLRRVIGEQLLIDFTPSAQPAWIVADKTQLDQVLMNLTVNARDAMPGGGKLTFSVNLVSCPAATVQMPKDCVELIVADTGHGMDAEVLARIFDPFFTTKAVGKGTGLGLATVYGIMQRSGGHIRVESQAGQGTRFRLNFPLSSPGTEEPVLTKAPTSEAPAAEASPSGITILVAEDDVIVRTLIASVLRAEGYRALLSADGAQAIELFDRHADEISIVVLDVIMPRKSGREVAEYVWNLKPQMPILFTSGYFTDGMDPAKLPPAPDQAQILRKPYGRQELIDRLRQIVSSQGAPPSVA